MSLVPAVDLTDDPVIDALRRARTEVELAQSVPELKDLADKAEAIRHYLRRAGHSLEEQNLAAEVRLEALRSAGNELRRMASEGTRLLGRPAKGSQSAKLSDLGIGPDDSSRWQQLATIPADVWQEKVEKVKALGLADPTGQAGELSMSKMLSLLKKEDRDIDVPPFPEGFFAVIYADPPWMYDFASTDESRAIENQYATMTLDELKTRVCPPAESDSVLYMWATNPKLAEALELIDAWGFQYRTNMVWVKDRIGMGYWARQRHELLLIAKRGNPPTPEPSDRPDSVVEAPRVKHSRKPEQFYRVIETAYPDFRKLEMFARSGREGWESWGNET